MLFSKHFEEVDVDFDVKRKMIEQVEIAIQYMGNVENTSEEIVEMFFKKLDGLREIMYEDAKAGFLGDPATYSIDEVILAYPGFFAVMIYRMAHELYVMNVPFIPRMMCEYAHSKTGIDINPGANIGKNFFIDHGTGVVIGETTDIGDNVKIYQGVTLGALSINDAGKTFVGKRHPTVEDGVTIYAGAAILGGKTVIGRDSVIGSNTFIIKSIPVGSKIKEDVTVTK